MTDWGNWSTCSATCGEGEQTRSRTCQAACEYSTDDLVQTQACNDHDCRSITIRSGEIIDAFYIEEGSSSQKFGFCGSSSTCEGSTSKMFDLAADEIIQSITYSRSKGLRYTNYVCRLSLHSNVRIIGPYSTSHCNTAVYQVDIPSGTTLINFFKSDAKTRTKYGYNFFDGFKSQYLISR